MQSLPVGFLKYPSQALRCYLLQLLPDLLLHVYHHGHEVDEYLSPVVLPGNALEGLAWKHDVDETPEGRFFITDVHQKHGHYEIHSLSVAQLWVKHRIGFKNIVQFVFA